jgi:hypothetical protein
MIKPSAADQIEPYLKEPVQTVYNELKDMGYDPDFILELLTITFGDENLYELPE